MQGEYPNVLIWLFVNANMLKKKKKIKNPSASGNDEESLQPH